MKLTAQLSESITRGGWQMEPLQYMSPTALKLRRHRKVTKRRRDVCMTDDEARRDNAEKKNYYLINYLLIRLAQSRLQSRDEGKTAPESHQVFFEQVGRNQLAE